MKLKVNDGKYCLTGVIDVEGMFRIIESVLSKNAEPIKFRLAKLGKSLIIKSNVLSYQYVDEDKHIEIE